MKLIVLCGLIALMGLLLSSPAMGQSESTVAVTVLYNENSCSSVPLTLGFEIGATCTTSTDSPGCMTFGENSTSFGRMDCTNDPSKYASAAFGETPHLLVEVYDSGVDCSEAFTSSIAFLADGNCHSTESSFSFVASISLDGSSTLAMHDGMNCEGDAFLDIRPESGSVGSGTCVEGFTRVYAGGKATSTGPWKGGALYTLGFYDNDLCSGPPMQLKLSQDEICTDPPSVPSPSCQTSVEEWGSSHSSYACVDDYFGYASKLFGGTPYLVVESHAGGGCQAFQEFVAFRADGVCSYAPGMNSSMVLNMRPNGSVLVSVYDAGGCKGTLRGTVEIWGEIINTGVCDGDSRHYIFGNSGVARGRDIALSLETMLPAWLWEPTQPRIFSSY